jgi:type I restriction enzyme S subunit
VGFLKAEIKERIEMISRGEVPKGYKKTKVGIIPEDWEVTRLEEDCNKINVGFVGTCEKYYTNRHEGIPMLRTGNIKDGKIKFDDLKYVTKEFHERNLKSQVNWGDILIARHGSNGEGALYDYDNESNSLNIVIVSPNKDSINTKYLYFQINGSNTKRQVIARTAGSTQGVINTKEIKKIRIIKANSKEQHKIAQILSTWDKAIELKEQLLEVKKEQKKGLMQGLLTGEVRLPGYDEEWEEVRLGDIGEFSTSSVNKKIENKQELVRLVNYMDVYNNYIIDDSIDYMIVSATESQIDKFSLQKGDVLFTPSSETADDIGHSAVVKTDQGKLLYSYHLVRLRFKKLMDLDFKGYVFNNTDILGKFTKLASGATRYTLNLDDFRETSIKIPKSLEEQKAIAQVLSTANKEIELLEEELEQLKLQKKGLMQLLLTGIIRVKS